MSCISAIVQEGQKMPFPIVFGIPVGTSEEELVRLRRGIVRVLKKEMGAPPSWTHVFFPKDMAPDPVEEADGCNTIYARLDTAMFHGKEDADTNAVRVITAVTQFISNFFSQRYEVEGFVGDLNSKWKCLIKAAA